MQVTTRQGVTLDVTLTATARIPGGHPEPIVEFRHQGGILCSCYYLSTFQAIPAGQGLCLEGDRICRQDLPPEAVASCQAWVTAAMEVHRG